MNNSQEAQMLIKFRSEGKKLVHLCPDWDFMAIHADTDEIAACCCDFELEDDQILRDELVVKIEEKRRAQGETPMLMVAAESTSQDFSTLGAPAHSGTDLGNRVAMMCMIVSNPSFRKDGWQKQVNDLLREMRDRILATKLAFTEDQLRTAVAQAREADIDLATAIWSNLLMDCEQVK